MAKYSADDVSKLVRERTKKAAESVIKDAEKRAEESIKDIEETVKKSTDASLLVVKEGQLLFSDVFKFKPEGVPDFPVTCYKLDDWSEAVRGFVPKPTGLHVWPKKELTDLVVGIELAENVWISGPTGSGKSSLIREFCAATCRPFIRFNGREDTEASTIFGAMDAKDGTTRWHDGDFTTAFRHGALVLMDEATVIPAGIMMGLQWSLEPDGKLLLTDKPGTTEDRVVERDPRFRAVYADNTRGMGDITGNHAGTNMMNTASLDRFGTNIHLGYLPVMEECTKLKKVFPTIDDKLIKKLVQFGGLVRKSHVQGDLTLTASPRALENILRKVALYGDISRAISASFLAKLEDDSEIDTVKRHFETCFDAAL